MSGWGSAGTSSWYISVVKGFSESLNDTHIFLTPSDEHKTSFGEESPMIGKCKASTLKDFLVKANQQIH